MLSDDEINEIRAEAAHYEEPRAVGVEALKLVQSRRRWVNDEDLAHVARLLDMSPAELEGVATFYNLVYREPVGRHVIHACDSVSCWIRDCDGLFDQLRQRLGIDFGQTTGDDRFTLLPIVCLGACDRAPALMVDHDLHGPVEPDGLDAILDRYE